MVSLERWKKRPTTHATLLHSLCSPWPSGIGMKFWCLGVWVVSFLLILLSAHELYSNDVRVAQLSREVRSKRWIVFSAREAKNDWDLFVMRPDGSNRQNITQTPETHETGGRFSPDGQKLLYRRIPKNTKVSHDQWGSQGQLVVANADGSNPVAIGGIGEFPWASWSPDAKQVACLSKKGIEIYDLATKQITRQLDRKGIYQQMFWSPDGKQFCGTANYYGESWTVVRMDLTTGSVNPINKFQNCTPDWFPDSRRIIFSYRPANQEVLDGGKRAQSVGQQLGYGWTQLWMADLEGKSKTLIYGEDGRHVYGGALSPDGRYVLFTRSNMDGGGLEEGGAPIGLMRLQDAPSIGGESPALRKLHPKTKDGPVLDLGMGWEPHWTYAEVGRKK
jgi:Tol biopolymer transport system component